MRAILQRVSSASVTVDDQIISKISKGLMVLIGIAKDDTKADSEYIVNKILNLRVFDDASGAMWKSNVKDVDGEILCVSQFTLFGSTLKAKPDFHSAMGAEPSKIMYTSLLERLGALYSPERVKDGRFGAMMSVQLTNEGPVTLTIDSRKFRYVENDTAPTNSAKAARASHYAQRPSKTIDADDVEGVPRDSPQPPSQNDV